MKTVRFEVFETNSSSTHSITIEKKRENVPDLPKLCENNILYTTRLGEYRNKDFYRDDDVTINCETRDQKAAFVAHVIAAIGDDESEVYKIHGKQMLIASLGYTDIVMPDKYDSEVSAYWDEGDFQLNTNTFIEDLAELIKVIEDDTLRIVNAHREW